MTATDDTGLPPARTRKPWNDPDPWTGDIWDIPQHFQPNPNGDHDDIPFGTPTGWEPLNLNTLPDTPPVQPTLGGIGIVYPGKRHVFSGPQESAKTLIAYAIAIQVVRSTGPIVIIDFEMGSYDARNRLQELGATADDIDRIHYIEPEQPATVDTANQLLALEPALVLVDAAAGAYDLQNLDDNKRSDVERFTRLYVTTLWRAGVATIVLDHVVKNTDTRGSYAIGSERKVGGADVHLGFHAITPIKRGTTGLYKITTHKDRGGYLKRGKLGEIELVSDPDTHHITWQFTLSDETDQDHGFRPTHLMQMVSDYMALRNEATSRNSINEHVTGKREYVLKAITILIDEGHLQETAEGIIFIHPYVSEPIPSTTKVVPVSQAPIGSGGSPGSQAVPSGSQASLTTTGSLVPPSYREGNQSGTRPEEPENGSWDDGIPF